MLALVLVVGVPCAIAEAMRRSDNDQVPFEDDGTTGQRARERDAGRRIYWAVQTMGERDG